MPVMDGDSQRCSVLHGSLVEPLLIAGVEKPLAIVNATLAMVVVADLRLYAWLPVAAGLHLLMRHINRDDPFTRRIYAKYNLQGTHYDPWPHVGQRRGRRPQGYGRGMLC